MGEGRRDAVVAHFDGGDRAMIIDRYEALALGAFAAGAAVFVVYVIPRIEFAIAAFDHIIGG